MLKFILFLRSISWTAAFSAALAVLAFTIFILDPRNNALQSIAIGVIANALATLRSYED
jgi:hypothetical protein